MVAGERPGQITEGKLVNTPVYLIVSSRSVTCNYIIMAEGKNAADESFNLLCRCLRVSCVVHLWSWKPINNKKQSATSAASFSFFLLSEKRRWSFILTFVVGSGGGRGLGRKKKYYSRLNESCQLRWTFVVVALQMFGSCGHTFLPPRKSSQDRDDVRLHGGQSPTARCHSST